VLSVTVIKTHEKYAAKCEVLNVTARGTRGYHWLFNCYKYRVEK
jgi:hypothetical protein